MVTLLTIHVILHYFTLSDEFKIKWRNDGKCGSEYPLPDGRPAECDPDGENPCCNDVWDGECGNTARYCSCLNCVDYSVIYREWKESGGKRKWRYDGRCGKYHPLPDDSPAECDPDGENPCCSSYGKCGNTTEHCSCSLCVDFAFVREWKESGGKTKWRNDGKCGRRYRLPDSSPAECDPDGENPCCSSYGKCGNTTEHCSCSLCVDFAFVREWKESGGKTKWRNDGKCGRRYRLPDSSPAECDPDGENPCCSRYGKCGNTTEHCSC